MQGGFTYILIVLSFSWCSNPGVCDTDGDAKITDVNVARTWLQGYNGRAQEVFFRAIDARWNYNTNLTDHNQEFSVNAQLEKALFKKEAAVNASQFDWQNFEDDDVRRQFRKISMVGKSLLEPEEIKRVDTLRDDMGELYSVAKVCDDTGKNCMPLEPNITRLYSKSSDWAELKRVWAKWRDVTGRKMKNMYTEYVGIKNKAARLNGFNDQGESWRSWYEMEGFEEECLRMWNQVKPLYQNLHAYVRRKLMHKYRDHAEEFPRTGHIPAHILGNNWAQTWTNILDYVLPYPNKTAIDVTDVLVQKGYNATRMFKTAEEFFTSLGLKRLPQRFWDHSMIVKPTDGRRVVCHASAWDFYNQKDFRIKQCTDITMNDLGIVHHEMGHVMYYLHYVDQPVMYRRGGNPGFHEAVGDVMSLSVSTPKHLHQIGLLQTNIEDEENDINFLMRQALRKIGFLPFGYLIDQWRWSVFTGDTSPDEYTEKWWELRCKFQGISPPVARSKDDFDPGAKFHVANDVPYIRYFISFIIQFQFHKSLCEAAGHTGPLLRCDIYRSRAAGTKLANMLRMGSSRPWPEAMEAITGQRNMDAEALLEYFQPLTEWLEEQNRGYNITWDESACPPGSFHDGASPGCHLAIPLYCLVILVTFWIMKR